MYHQAHIYILRAGMAGAIALFFPAAAFAGDAAASASAPQFTEKFDAEAAVALANKDNCWKCHHLTKKKEGPTYQSVAEKYRGKPEALDKLVKHITLGKDVITLSDGHKELHKFDQKRPPDQIRNLILYILAQ